MAYAYQHVIVLEILAVRLVNFRHVEVAFFAIMVLAGVLTMQSVNVIKRMEKQNITVKAVICLLHAMGIHVKMAEHAQAEVKLTILRSVSQVLFS